MSTGIDKKFIQDYYQSITDQELITVLTRNAAGLTQEALEVVREEIKRRELDPEIISIVEAQQETDDPGEIKVFDPDACPVDEPTRIWLEQSFLFLLDLFGEENTLNRKVLIPERIHFPVKYDGSERAAFQTLRIVADQMELAADKITLDFYDENLRRITEGTPGGFYWGKGENGNFEISLARKKLGEPENMIAILAHEIAHIKLLGENRMAENDEKITDLTTMFFGLGVFNANAAFQTSNDAKSYGWSQSGYLTQMEWGYALALFAYIRRETQPEWFEYLCNNVKGDFKQGQKFISNNEDSLFRS